jgi:hypothetical protein
LQLVAVWPAFRKEQLKGVYDIIFLPLWVNGFNFFTASENRPGGDFEVMFFSELQTRGRTKSVSLPYSSTRGHWGVRLLLSHAPEFLLIFLSVGVCQAFFSVFVSWGSRGVVGSHLGVGECLLHASALLSHFLSVGEFFARIIVAIS